MKKINRHKDKYNNVFNNNPEGIEILKDLRDKFGGPSFSKNPDTGVVDPLEMAYKEGQRSVLLYIEYGTKGESNDG